MTFYLENIDKLKSPIKYYRMILNITQKELAGEKYTRGYIQTLESGKRVPPYKCAVYLVEKISEIAKEKKIDIDVTMDEFTKNENERMYDFLLKRIEYIGGGKKEQNYIKKYKYLASVINEFNFADLETKVNILIADELLKGKKYAEAKDYYEKILEKIKYNQYTINEISVLRKLGTCFLKIQNYDKSIEKYSKAEELYDSNKLDDNEEYIKILFNLSLAFKKNKDINNSIKYIKKALCIDGLNKKNIYNLKLQIANNYQDAKEFEKALKIYQELYIENPDEYLLNYNLAITFDFLGERDETEKYLGKCLSSKFEENEQKSIYSLMLLAKLKLEKNDSVTAKKCFNYAMDIASKFKDGEMLIYTISNIYELLEKNKMSEKFLEYFDSIIKNEEIILRNNNKISNILIVLLKCSVEIELTNEDRDKIKNIIQIIERGM